MNRKSRQIHNTGGVLQTGKVSQSFRHQIARGTISTGSLLRPFCSRKVKFYVYKDLGKRDFELCLLFEMHVVAQVRKLIQMNFNVFSYLEHVVNEIY